MPRCWATAATPAVRQLPSAASTISTGAAPRSSEAKHSGWSASKVYVCVAVLLAEAAEAVTVDWLYVPCTHGMWRAR